MSSGIEFPIFDYNPQQYNSALIRGTDIGPRPYNLARQVVARTPLGGTLIDVGCGSAVKLLALVNHMTRIYGMDKNLGVISEARKNINSAGVSNIELLVGNGDNLPFPNGFANTITYVLCPHNAREACRVVKPGGVVIADRVGEQDKASLKGHFRSSDSNQRGYRSEMQIGEIAKKHKVEFTEAGFNNVTCTDFFWQTRYSPEGIWQLINSTPTIKDFNPISDRKAFERACSELVDSGRITLTQHRVLVIAEK